MFNNKFLKNDPLLEAVKAAQAEGTRRRQAEAQVNEEFGVYSRQAVIRENLAAYDARLVELLSEEKADKDYDKDGKVESDKAEYQGSRIRAAKKAGKMEEGTLDPKDSDVTAASKTITKAAPKEDPSLPSSYPGAASSAPTAQRLSNAKAAIKESIKLKISAPKQFKEKRHPNPGAVTKAPVPGVSIAEGEIEEGKKWIAGAIKHPGSLSKKLGVPEKKNIPSSKLAVKSGDTAATKKQKILAKTLKKFHKEDVSFNAAQVTGKSVEEQVVDMAPPPALHGPAVAGQTMKQAPRPVNMSYSRGASQTPTNVRPNVSTSGRFSVQQGMSQAGRSAASTRATVPQPPVTAGTRAGVGGAEAAVAGRSIASTAARGVMKALGPIGTAAAVMDPTPANKGENEFARQAKYASPKTNSPELSKTTSGTPTTFQKSSTVGPSPTKFSNGTAPTTAAKPTVKQSFSQAYQAARSSVKPGEDASKAQFKWTNNKGVEGTYQAAAKKSDYVTPSKQIKTDVGTPAPVSAPETKTQTPGPETSTLPDFKSDIKSAGPATAPLTSKAFAKQPPSTMKESVEVGTNKYRIV